MFINNLEKNKNNNWKFLLYLIICCFIFREHFKSLRLFFSELPMKKIKTDFIENFFP